MKTILSFLFCLSLTITHAGNGEFQLFTPLIQSMDSTGYGVSFNTRMIDLGKMKRGESRQDSFILTNTGTIDLKIELVSSCECTTVDHTFQAIKPGETTTIVFTFDSTDKEKSGTTDVDIYFQNPDPKSPDPLFEILQYSYILLD